MPEVVAPEVQTLAVEFSKASPKYSKPLVKLLEKFKPVDLERFARLWGQIRDEFRDEFIAFVATGEDPNGEFLDYLDESQACQEAVDLLFTRHIQSMHHLASAMENTIQPVETIVDQDFLDTVRAQAAETSVESAADEAVRLRALLAQTLEAKATLESLEQHMGSESSTEAIQEKIRQSASFAAQAYRELKLLTD